MAGKKAPPPVKPIDKGILAAHWATALFTALHGKLIYSETPNRSALYDRVKAGLAKQMTQAEIIADIAANLAESDADCSQFVATCEMAAGHAQYNDRDYTGTELQEGVEVTQAQATPGCYVIYGGGTGEHVDMLVAPNGADWWIIGFGGAGGPGHGLLSGSEPWFAAHGYPGLRFLRPS